jgi:hypothetical protein
MTRKNFTNGFLLGVLAPAQHYFNKDPRCSIACYQVSRFLKALRKSGREYGSLTVGVCILIITVKKMVETRVTKTIMYLALILSVIALTSLAGCSIVRQPSPEEYEDVRQNKKAIGVVSPYGFARQQRGSPST